MRYMLPHCAVRHRTYYYFQPYRLKGFMKITTNLMQQD